MIYNHILLRMLPFEDKDHEIKIWSTREVSNRKYEIAQEKDYPVTVRLYLIDNKGDSILQEEEEIPSLEEAVKWLMAKEKLNLDNFLYNENYTEDFVKGYRHGLETSKAVLIQHKMMLGNNENDEWAKSALNNAQRDLQSKLHYAPSLKEEKKIEGNSRKEKWWCVSGFWEAPESHVVYMMFVRASSRGDAIQVYHDTVQKEKSLNISHLRSNKFEMYSLNYSLTTASEVPNEVYSIG